MHKELIILAFEKARKDTGSEKLTRLSNYLSDYIQEDSGEVYGEKSLRINYNLVRNDNEKQIDLKSYIVEALSHYLGYDNYLDFLNKTTIIETSSKSDNNLSIREFIKKNKITIIVSLLIIIGFVSTIAITKQRWMVWQEDHYVEVKFNSEKYKLNQLKLYNGDRVKNFQKIDAVCNTKFFEMDGKVKVWYGKNVNGGLEYFTSLGKHPETGKTLKPITKYMIDKYLCN
ncbi:hypothetical protein JYT89_01650 [Flavobacteriaceae bacterium AH-315-B10]|nr:hypothetical protein [Flavobacteriaceae bacterium AH-315-B10]